MKVLWAVLVSWVIFSPSSYAQDESFCNLRNDAFKAGEQVVFRIYYNLGMIYVPAGEARFRTTLEQLEGKPVFHVVGDGYTFHSYDWIFKVRDRYESYIDTSTLLPVRFIRDVHEGDYHIYNYVNFNQQRHLATSLKGTFNVPSCIQDVLSAIYAARNIRFDSYLPGAKIPFYMFLDNQVYHLYIRYMGKEQIETRYGTFNAIKFKPLLIKGTIFQGGEKMTVWVSDDRNHIPLRINSPISVGSIKVDMIGYSDLLYPLTSMISKR